MVGKNMQLKRVLWTYLLCCWASVVYASELTFAEGVDSIPFRALGYVIGLAILGGMASTLPKIVNPTIQIRNVWLEMLKDTVASVVAGLVLFFLATWLQWPWPLQCLVILLGGAGNAKVIDMALNKGLMPGLSNALGKVPGAAQHHEPDKAPTNDAPTPP
jgi:hypothetical protein